MAGIVILFLLALAARRHPYPLLCASGYALLVFLWGLVHDDPSGALARAMMTLAFGLIFFLTLDRTRHLPWAWLLTLAIGLLAWGFWPYLVM